MSDKFSVLGRLVTMIVKVPEEWLGLLCDLVEKLISKAGNEWHVELAHFLRREPCWVVAMETAEKANVYFRRLFGKKSIVISATDGTETFASSGLFTGGIFGETLPAVEQPVSTPRVKVTVNEQIRDGIFSEIFGSIKAGEFEWEQSQVTQFCRDHRDKLRTNGYATFFRLKGGFVASVSRLGDELGVLVRAFSYDRVWLAEYRRRFVLPQQ